MNKIIELYEESLNQREEMIERYEAEYKRMLYRERKLVDDLADVVIENMALKEQKEILKDIIFSLNEEIASIREASYSESQKRIEIEVLIKNTTKKIERYV